jgi:signal peptidase I
MKILCTSTKRLPWLAGLLSLLAPSLGHCYLGLAKRGILPVLGLLTMIFLGGWLKLFVTFWGVLLLHFAHLALIIWAIVDSIRIAISEDFEFVPKFYNRWYVYVLGFIILHATGVLIFKNRSTWLHFESYRVSAISMYPTLHSQEMILVDTEAYKTTPPKRGDVIVFHPPDNPDTLFVKRVIAVSGDTISVNKSGIVYLNRSRIQEPYIFANALQADDSTNKIKDLSIPEKNLFVLGDNRNNSRDSRYFGTVALQKIIGKVTYIWMSDEFSRIGTVVQ